MTEKDLEINKIEFHSEELDEILGRSPRWIVRRGITIIAAILLIIFVGSYFFKYPEMVSAPVYISTYHVPAGIKAKAEGKIDSIFISNNAAVSSGEYLAIIHNTASFSDVLKLRGFIDTVGIFFKTGNASDLKSPDSFINLRLGDINTASLKFMSTLQELLFFVDNPYYSGKGNNLSSQMVKYDAISKKSSEEILIKKEQLLLEKKQFERDSSLFSNGTISSSELEKSRSTYLDAKLTYQSSLSALDNMQVTIYQLEQNKLELNNTYSETYKQLIIDLRSEYEEVNNAIDTWENNYILKSPIDGKVTFTRYWNKNQNVNPGDTVFTIIPAHADSLTGIINLSTRGSGKVKAGQAVKIKFDNYPYMEYGIVTGYIKNISLVPSGDNYIAEVLFPNGLKSNYGTVLSFRQQMRGTAEIITEDVRLIERFVNPLRSLWKRQTD